MPIRTIDTISSSSNIIESLIPSPSSFHITPPNFPHAFTRSWHQPQRYTSAKKLKCSGTREYRQRSVSDWKYSGQWSRCEIEKRRTKPGRFHNLPWEFPLLPRQYLQELSDKRTREQTPSKSVSVARRGVRTLPSRVEGN
jgi:hypothetical protein